MMTTAEADVTESLNREQIVRFRADGFIAIPRLLDEATLATLRDYYDKIVRREIVLPSDRQLGGVTRQVMMPSKHIEFFRDNPAVRRGFAIARQLFDRDDVGLCFDMLIFKPPMHPKPTPWHQDFAYNAMPFAPADPAMRGVGLQFWVALDDVDFANGCMHFVPGVHEQGLREHFVYAGEPTDPGRLLATRAFGDADLPNDAVACPLAAGGCTIHLDSTPHYTPPNITADRGRRAYIFNVRPIDSV